MVTQFCRKIVLGRKSRFYQLNLILSRELDKRRRAKEFALFGGCFASEVGNIARGTTDPEIDSVTWIELGNNMAPLTLVANLATRWRHLH